MSEPEPIASLEHRRCGEPGGDVDERADGSPVVWLACDGCEAQIVREA